MTNKVAIISDVHANLEALEAVMEDIDKEEVREIYSLGDVVGYGASPNAVIELFKKYGIESVKGNHDAAVFDEEVQSLFNTHAYDAIDKTREILSDESKKYLNELKTAFVFSAIRLVHGCPPDSFEEYIPRDVSYSGAFNKFKESVCFVGHTHVAGATFMETKSYETVPVTLSLKNEEYLAVRKDGRCIFNPGSVGQPRDTPESKYCIVYQDYEDEIEIEQRRIPYDIEKAAGKIRKTMKDDWLAERLYEGR